MSYIFSRALVEASLLASSLDIDASAQLSGIPTPKPCLWHDKTMAPSRLSRFGMTCEPFEAIRGEALLMSFVAAFRAKTLAQPEAEQESTANDPDYGAKWLASSVRYDPATSSWKTAHCLWEEDLPWSSVILPKWGMTRNGHVFRHPTRERPISGIVSGLWPTPNARDYKGAPGAGCVERGGRQSSLPQAVKTRTWPTATATATASKGWSKNHNRANSDDRLDYTVERENFQPGQQTPPMRLNPNWVEWLMGWPIGHTELKPLATDKFREWQQQHSAC